MANIPQSSPAQVIPRVIHSSFAFVFSIFLSSFECFLNNFASSTSERQSLDGDSSVSVSHPGDFYVLFTFFECFAQAEAGGWEAVIAEFK